MTVPRGLIIRSSLAALVFGALLWSATGWAQSQNMPSPDWNNNNNPVNHQQLADLDRFLDSHPELARQLQKDPSLANNQEFLQGHPEFQRFLEDHPAVSAALRQNAGAVMHEEDRYEHSEDRDRDRDRGDITRGELRSMDSFLDSHPEIAEQLRKDPNLVNDRRFVDGHPALRQYLADHPGVREEIRENPNAFMHREDRFDQRQDMGGHGITREELASMDNFLDNHPEIAEQLRKDPSLVDNRKFVDDHPPLRQFLADHPAVRAEIKQDPNAFMRDERRFDQHGDMGMRGDRDWDHHQLFSFNEFLKGHQSIAGELARDPSLATNQEYLENHPDLRDYLQANPEVHQGLAQNPQSFVKSAEQVDSMPKNWTTDPKLKDNK
jgi:hypothetical protein